MRKIALVAGAAASLMIVPPAFAADPKPKPDRSQQIVCKTESAVGSHIPDRICRTRAEWDEAAKQSQQYMDQRKMGSDPMSLCGKACSTGG